MFNELLKRYERAAADAARTKHLEDILSVKQNALERTTMHLTEARRSEGAMERKLEEWIEHARHLRKQLSPRMKKLVPKEPAPLRDDVPF